MGEMTKDTALLKQHCNINYTVSSATIITTRPHKYQPLLWELFTFVEVIKHSQSQSKHRQLGGI